MKNYKILKREIGICLLAALMLGAPAVVRGANANGYPMIERIYGQDRLETSVKVAQRLYPKGATAVILASGQDYPDALSGVPLARQKNAPLLLVGPSPETSTQVLDYLKEGLAPKGRVYLLGGAGAISDSFITAIQQLGFSDIVRLGGQDRYETSLAIAQEISHDGKEYYLVSGDNFPDALSASVLAATTRSVPTTKAAYMKTQGVELTPAIGGVPILLLPSRGAVPDSILNYLNNAKVEGKQDLHIVGGNAAIPESSVSQLKDAVQRVGDVSRASGMDRYETNYAANSKAFDLSWQSNGEGLPVPKVFLTTGLNFADALSGAVMAAQNISPLVLIDDSLPEGAVKLLQEFYESNKRRNARTEMFVLGGPGAIKPDTVMAADYAYNYGKTASGQGTIKEYAENASPLLFPSDVAKAADGTLYISDSQNHTIKVLEPSGKIRLIGAVAKTKDKYGRPVGGYADGTAETAQFNEPKGLALDSARNLYIVDSGNGALRRLNRDGMVTTVIKGLKMPIDIVLASSGEYYLSDSLNHRIIKGTADGKWETFAGGGYEEKNGWLVGAHRDGSKTEAKFNEPGGLALGNNGVLYVADAGNQKIRVLDSNGTVTTLAGAGSESIADTNYTTGGYRDGAALQARFNFPGGLTADASGNLLIADTYNHRIRMLTPDGQVTTLAGTGSIGKENGYPEQARFNGPVSIIPDGNDAYLIVDQFNQMIRRLTTK